MCYKFLKIEVFRKLYPKISVKLLLQELVRCHDISNSLTRIFGHRISHTFAIINHCSKCHLTFSWFNPLTHDYFTSEHFIFCNSFTYNKQMSIKNGSKRSQKKSNKQNLSQHLIQSDANYF